MHGAAQWGVFNTISSGGWIALPDNVRHLDADAVLRLAERERVLSLPVVGDAMARPLLDLIETGDYDLSGLMGITNGVPAVATVRDRLLTALPNAFIMDAVGASGPARNDHHRHQGAETKAATFTLDDTTVVSGGFQPVLQPGGEGWLARREFVPLGYLGDAEKTARTFPTIDGVRWSIPGDKARLLADGQIELLGRDSVTINSGGKDLRRGGRAGGGQPSGGLRRGRGGPALGALGQ